EAPEGGQCPLPKGVGPYGWVNPDDGLETRERLRACPPANHPQDRRGSRGGAQGAFETGGL
ncbi:MAG: hypothetical protein AVDCRST_MAG28-4159, partial [uncultured Rubrobacteraceae bacterium]